MFTLEQLFKEMSKFGKLLYDEKNTQNCRRKTRKKKKKKKKNHILPENAPICCVIPPNSWATTLVSLKASNRVVFPWSTWPIIVTTGGRFTSTEGSGGGLQHNISRNIRKGVLGVMQTVKINISQQRYIHVVL